MESFRNFFECIADKVINRPRLRLGRLIAWSAMHENKIFRI
jgi:hypothetical protein